MNLSSESIERPGGWKAASRDKRQWVFLNLFIACVILCASSPANARKNGSAMVGFAWSETVGWINFSPSSGGVTVYDTHLTGCAWSENLGWIRMSANGDGPHANTGASDWGVNRDPSGRLSGYAWSETAGWIRFDPAHSRVTIDPDTGVCDNYAWSENLGWIHFRCPHDSYGVFARANGSGTAAVPTLNEWGMIVLILLLAAFSIWMIKEV